MAMLNILTIKHFHITFAVLTAAGMLLRGSWRFTNPDKLKRRWVKTLPHINDTLLFATGLLMVIHFRWWPFDIPWLTAKLTALFAYIILGGIALRQGGSSGLRAAAWGAALLVLLYIFSVALTKQPLPFV